MSYPLETLAERAWYAYLCLPRDGKRPPAMSSLENRVDKKTGRQMGRADGPAPATFAKLFKGERDEPRRATREAIARVLNVAWSWLEDGIGDPPKLTGPYREMPRDESLREHHPEEWAKKYAAIGGPNAQPNNFQIAVLFYGSSLTSAAIEEVAKSATGRENDLLPIGWGKLLSEAQSRLVPDKKPKTGAAPKSERTPARRRAPRR